MWGYYCKHKAVNVNCVGKMRILLYRACAGGTQNRNHDDQAVAYAYNHKPAGGMHRPIGPTVIGGTPTQRGHAITLLIVLVCHPTPKGASNTKMDLF